MREAPPMPISREYRDRMEVRWPIGVGDPFHSLDPSHK